MSQVKYHKFTRDIPIIFVESFDEFLANVPGEYLKESDELSNQSSYFRVFSINETDIHYILFNEGMLKQLFGEANKQTAIDSTLALYAGHRKFPQNEERAYTHALQLLVREDRIDAYRAIKSAYISKFRMIPEDSRLVAGNTKKSEEELDSVLFGEAESNAAKQAHKMGLTSKAGGKWYDKKGRYVARTVGDKLVKASSKETSAPKRKSAPAPSRATPKKAPTSKAKSSKEKAPVKGNGSGGRDYENRVAKNIASSGFGKKGFSPAGADANAPDAMFVIKGKDYKMELKMQGAQMGGTSIVMKNGRWLMPGADPKSPMNAFIIKQLNSKKKDAERLIKFLKSQPGNKGLTNDWPPGQITTDSWEKAVQKGLIKPLNIRVDTNSKEALQFVIDHYKHKNTHYINIEGLGTYYLDSNPAGLNVPPLSAAGNMQIEVRFARSGSKKRSDGFKVCGAGCRMQARLKPTNKSIKSPNSVDSPEASKKLFSSRKTK